MRGNSYFDILDRTASLHVLPRNDCEGRPGKTCLLSGSLAGPEVLRRSSHTGLDRRSTLSSAICSLSLNQGGRSCAGARVAPAEKFGLGRKF